MQHDQSEERSVGSNVRERPPSEPKSRRISVGTLLGEIRACGSLSFVFFYVLLCSFMFFYVVLSVKLPFGVGRWERWERWEQAQTVTCTRVDLWILRQGCMVVSEDSEDTLTTLDETKFCSLGDPVACPLHTRLNHARFRC